MTDLGRPYSDDISSSQSEDFNRAHAEEDPSEVHNGDNPEDSSYSPYEQSHSDKEAEKMKKSALLQSWTGVFKKWKKTDSETHSTSSGGIKILPNGTRCSPPVSPLLDRKHWDALTGDLKPNFPPGSVGYKYDTLESELTSIHPAEYYAEKLEVYQLKYSYLKSWPGLLRLLAGLQLVFGGMVFACVCAYIQRDSEWSNYYRPNYGLAGAQGYRYNGPLTAFVLVIVGLSWLLTVILLVLGLTMYYRTILLDSKWCKLAYVSERAEERKILTGAIPTGHIPKPRVIADYIIKYPEIHSVEDREQYKAVFNDQYQEYKDLHREITATLMKFQELDSMMSQLINNRRNPERINGLLKKYDQKKNDPYFLEKKERCEYLKGKLSHIKMRIRDCDQNFTAKDSNY
uniref:MARVEL domain-containing protein 2-like n=1 Tax=Sinocyclocheilus anshuiensis TaxID=1608454 RepID=A0A671NUQ1_9TELE